MSNEKNGRPKTVDLAPATTGPTLSAGRARPRDLSAGCDLHGFFREQVERAVEHQRAPVSDGVVYYLTNLLADSATSEDAPGGRTLVELRQEAIAARPTEAVMLWRRLGDYAMVVAGFFHESIRRRTVDRRYYEQVGASAYWTVEGRHFRSDPGLFAELAEGFRTCTELLTEVREEVRERDDDDVLRLYEEWLATGSPRIAERLRELGVVPAQAGGSG